jgi:hypothetical protein
MTRCASRRCGRILAKGKYCDRFCMKHAKSDRDALVAKCRRKLAKAPEPWRFRGTYDEEKP